MIELVTGCLQNDSKKLGDFYERYFPYDFEGTPAEALELAIPKLVEDVDPLAEEWEDGILASVCKLAIRCIQTNRMKRPTTNELVEKLGRLAGQTYHDVNGSPKASCGDKTGTSSVNESAERCELCGMLSTHVSICNDHFTCQQCFENHVFMHLGEMTIRCPFIGCDKLFSIKDMLESKILSSYLCILHLNKQNENDKWSKMWEQLKKLHEVQKETQEYMPRIIKALATVSAAVVANCPKIVYIVPSCEQGATFWKWPRDFVQTKVQIFFVCQHSFHVVTEACITTWVTKKWVTSVAPAIKFSILLLKVAAAAGKIITGLHGSIESIEKVAIDMINDPLTREVLTNIDEFLTKNTSILDKNGKKTRKCNRKRNR